MRVHRDLQKGGHTMIVIKLKVSLETQQNKSKSELEQKNLEIFFNLERNWQLVSDPLCFQNNIHKKRLGSLKKMKLYFLKIFDDLF